MEVSDGEDFDKEEVLCQPCYSEGEIIAAEGFCETCQEYFCSGCLRFHRKQSMTRNHDIKVKDKMPVGQLQTDPCVEPCSTHRTEIIKFYCKAHDVVGCGDCMVLDHKSCKVDLVKNVSRYYKEGIDLIQIMRAITKYQKEIDAYKRTKKLNLKAFAKLTRKKTANRYFEMDEYLDPFGYEVVNEVDGVEFEEQILQTKIKKEFETIEVKLAEFQRQLNEQIEKVSQLFVTAKRAKRQLKDFEKSMESFASQIQTKKKHSEPSKDLANLKEIEIPIGNIKTSTIAQKEDKEDEEFNTRL